MCIEQRVCCPLGQYRHEAKQRVIIEATILQNNRENPEPERHRSRASYNVEVGWGGLRSMREPFRSEIPECTTTNSEETENDTTDPIERDSGSECRESVLTDKQYPE